jgi:hypothetical protein
LGSAVHSKTFVASSFHSAANCLSDSNRRPHFQLLFLPWADNLQSAFPLGARLHLNLTSANPAVLSASPQPSAYSFPLKVSENRRYLVDQRGRPFRIQGDSAQSLIANLTYAEAETYLTDRRNKEFNTVNINLLERKFAINAPKNRRGDDSAGARDWVLVLEVNENSKH